MSRRALQNIGRLVLGCALALSLGCQQPYDPPSLINKLRVVAVNAQPPVLTTAPTTLRPLVIGNDPEQGLCYAWSLCLFAVSQNGNYVCVDPELEVGLGNEPTAKVALVDALTLLPKIPGVFEKLKIELPKGLGLPDPSDANKQPSLEDLSGLEIFVRFKVAEDGAAACPTDTAKWLDQPCADRTTCLAGYKRIAIATADKDKHTNPELTGLELDGVLWPADVTPTVRCYGGDDGYGQSGSGAVPMKPVWSPESIEVIGPNPDPTKTEPLEEGMLFSWLSTEGGWDKQRSYDDVPENDFYPPDYDGEPTRRVRIWVVLRDGRNGTVWTTRQVDVSASAPATGHPLCREKADLPGCSDLK
ncbi:MAG: hypothetical protein KC502_02115 [Myxococcales bacterium]|nr:hypothetical protein [Myxococcales bacterium]